MPVDHTMKANDTRPAYKFTLGFALTATETLPTGWTQLRAADSDGTGRLAIPTGYFTGSTVDVIVRAAVATDLTDDTTWTPGTLTATINVPASTWTPTTGAGQLNWTPAQTSTPGPYLIEHEVHWGPTDLETFPVRGFNSLLLLADLDVAS